MQEEGTKSCVVKVRDTAETELADESDSLAPDGKVIELGNCAGRMLVDPSQVWTQGNSLFRLPCCILQGLEPEVEIA